MKLFYNVIITFFSSVIYETKASLSITVADTETEQLGFAGFSCVEDNSNVEPSISQSIPQTASVSKEFKPATKAKASNPALSAATAWPSLDAPMDAWMGWGRNGVVQPFRETYGSTGRYSYSAQWTFLSLSSELMLKDTLECKEAQEGDLADALFQTLYAAVEERSSSSNIADYDKYEGCQASDLEVHIRVDDWSGYPLMDFTWRIEWDNQTQRFQSAGPYGKSNLGATYSAWRQAHPRPPPYLRSPRTTTRATQKVTSLLDSHGLDGWALRRLIYTPKEILEVGGLVGHLIDRWSA